MKGKKYTEEVSFDGGKRVRKVHGKANNGRMSQRK